jgi:hypothetical protein
MENTYVIAWKSRAEPRFGQGKRLLSREQAERLADELNYDYPAFVHEALNLAAGPETPIVPDNIVAPEFSAPQEPAEQAAFV